MSGLLAASCWSGAAGGRRFRAGGERTRRTRRRHRGAARVDRSYAGARARHARLGVEITTRKILDQPGADLHDRCPQVLTAWERVYRVLRDAFSAQRYHRGKGLRFEQSATALVRILPMAARHTATFSSAPTVCARPCASNACPISRRSMPVCGVARAAARERIPPAIHRELFMICRSACRRASNASAIRSPGRTMICGQAIAAGHGVVPAGGRGERTAWLLTDESDITHAIPIPPPLIRREAVARCVRRPSGLWRGHCATS